MLNSEKDIKILVLGRTASGKDTIVRTLCEDFGMTQVLSYTTRPRREGEGDTHTFITPEEAPSYTDRIAETKIGEIEYFATATQVAENDIYIIDPPGAAQLLRSMPDTKFLVVNILADDETRKNRYLKRDKNQKISFEDRDKAETMRFSVWEELCSVPSNLIDLHQNVVGVMNIPNTDDSKIEELCKMIDETRLWHFRSLSEREER